ncbi:efflux RND transporter periplasmic adaptor subunit [bacterium]|nr:efflux RND transporter periplasmic adaptor subunit [bacterium]
MRKYRITLVFGSLALFSVSCTKSSTNEDGKTKATVFVDQVKSSTFREEILYPGRVLSEVMASVKAPSAGRVTRVYHHVGDAVQRGTPLVSIKNLDPGFVYSAVMVRAPVSGRIWQLAVTSGTELNAGDKVASLIDPDKLEIRVEVPASDLEKVEEASDIILLRENHENLSLSKAHVSPMVDLQTGTSTCVLKLPENSEAKLLPGQLVSIKILGPPRQAITINGDAIKYRRGIPHVQLFEEGSVVKLHEVKVGLNRGDKVEILEGLVDGQKVVVRSTKYISDGEEVVLYVEPEVIKAKTEKSPAR